MQGSTLYYFIGLPGCGKSHAMQLMLGNPGVVGVDMDAHIQYKVGDSISNIVQQHGWDYFRNLEKIALHELTEKYLIDDSDIKIIACGGGTPCFFDNIQYMKKNGVVVWFNTAIDINVSRLIGTENVRPMLQDNPSDKMTAFLTNLMKERKPFYEQADIVLSEPINSFDILQNLLKSYETK